MNLFRAASMNHFFSKVFFDNRDHDLIRIVNGIREMTETKGLRIAYAVAYLLNSLEVVSRKMPASRAMTRMFIFSRFFSKSSASAPWIKTIDFLMGRHTGRHGADTEVCPTMGTATSLNKNPGLSGPGLWRH
jgi:hypothetical protein